MLGVVGLYYEKMREDVLRGSVAHWARGLLDSKEAAFASNALDRYPPIAWVGSHRMTQDTLTPKAPANTHLPQGFLGKCEGILLNEYY